MQQKLVEFWQTKNNKADFITQNLLIQTNLIHHLIFSWNKKLNFLGSSCVYPKNCKQPIKESYLLDGKLKKQMMLMLLQKLLE